MLNQTSRRLQQQLAAILSVRPDTITPTCRFDALIARAERRQVWRCLGEAGFCLPPLCLSSRVFLLVVLLILSPLAALALLLRSWSVFLSLPELGVLAHRLTRPWAVYPPANCATVYEAAVNLAEFRHSDYQVGLWPREAIAAKVRMIVAEATGMRFESLTEETSLGNLC